MTDLNTEKKFPRVVVGAYIFNKEGKMFVMRSPSWGGRLIGPGGHVEYGETGEEALKREVKEETNLDIADIELLGTLELVEHPGYKSKKHFLGLNYRANVVGEDYEIKLDEREASEYFWLTPEEIVKRDDVVDIVKENVEKFLIKDKKSFWGSKECKDCSANTDKIEEYKKDWQRALADYKNLQKETSERRGEWAQMSKANILEDFIPVYDNFKSAFFHHPQLQVDNEEHKQMKNWIDGVGFIMKQFGDVMKAHGIEEIKTVGEKFDPNMHESMGEEEVEGKEPGIVIKELIGGYKMGGKIIKAAKVTITK